MNDRTILRDLAKQYMDVCCEPVQNERRALWRRLNSLKECRPLIYVRAFAWREMPQAQRVCGDPLFRAYEDFFRSHLFWAALGDDSIFEPWLPYQAAHRCTDWGVTVARTRPQEAGGAYKLHYPIRELADIEKLRPLRHEIDEEKTSRDADRLSEAVGDILPVDVDRSPYFRRWGPGDLAYTLGILRGIEHFMLDMADNPEWLHRLMGFLSENVLRTHEQAEAAGDWGLSSNNNQAMPYATELPAPAANTRGVKRKQLWYFVAAQELTTVSPAMHEEFMLRYQLPLLKPFGLTAYGCCEDLTRKISMLRQVPNLRRIAVTPTANVARCAEQIGGDYVASYRPNPTDMVSCGFDPARIRSILRRDLAVLHQNGCHIDITLKDVETVERDPARVRKWVEITRDVVEEVWGGG